MTGRSLANVALVVAILVAACAAPLPGTRTSAPSLIVPSGTTVAPSRSPESPGPSTSLQTPSPDWRVVTFSGLGLTATYPMHWTSREGGIGTIETENTRIMLERSPLPGPGEDLREIALSYLAGEAGVIDERAATISGHDGIRLDVHAAAGQLTGFVVAVDDADSVVRIEVLQTAAGVSERAEAEAIVASVTILAPCAGLSARAEVRFPLSVVTGSGALCVILARRACRGRGCAAGRRQTALAGRSPHCPMGPVQAGRDLGTAERRRRSRRRRPRSRTEPSCTRLIGRPVASAWRSRSTPRSSWSTWLSRRSKSYEANAGSVAWSPDGLIVAFGALAGTDPTDSIGMLDPATGQTSVLHRGAAADPAWAPDGRTIAFVADAGYDSHPVVWLIDADGGDARPLTPVPPRASAPESSLAPNDACLPQGFVAGGDVDAAPAWMPDGSIDRLRTELVSDRFGDGQR